MPSIRGHATIADTASSILNATVNQTLDFLNGIVTFNGAASQIVVTADGFTFQPEGIPSVRIGGVSGETRFVGTASWADNSISASYAPSLLTLTSSYLSGSAHIYNFRLAQSTLSPSTTMSLDFDAPNTQILNTSGSVLFQSSNSDIGKSISLRVNATNTMTPTFPAGWVWMTSGSVAPTTLGSGKVGLLSLTCFGPNDTDIVAIWVAQT